MKVILIAASAASLILPLQSYAASIIGLGDLAGGSFSSKANRVSADGRYVVGSSISSSGEEAFIYHNGQMTGLGDLPGGSFRSIAHGVSADGSTAAGWSSSASGTEGFIHQNGQMTRLSNLSSSSFSNVAFDISDDGNTVVGSSFISSSFEAFTHQNGQVTRLGHLGCDSSSDEELGTSTCNGHTSIAAGVSADGSTAVGSSSFSSREEAFIHQNGQMIGLGDLPGGRFYSVAQDVSANGNTVVGLSESGLGVEAFIYQNGQISGLGDLAHGKFTSIANGVSADGNTVVGKGSSSSGSEAAVWQGDGNGGYAITSLTDKLFLLGVDVKEENWTSLSNAVGVSDDGNVIVGHGIRNGQVEAFLVNLNTAVVPVPTAAWMFGSALIGLTGLRKLKK